ncbi:MAG TPA: hypothetical protein VNI52_11330 [Sphingobacteriaceae bacterium]|nr:hypothetical protein [Sphingobacteriaceae bacterium]
MLVATLRLLSVICLAFIADSLHAQQRTFRGVIYEQGTALRVSDAVIQNIFSGTSVKSNHLGEFKIIAQSTDTLLIKRPEYADYKTVASSQNIVLIQLYKIRQLKEVVITGQTRKQEMEEVLAGYRKKGVYYNGKPPLLTYLFKPLTAIYELIGRDPGNARRFNNYYRRELEETEIDRRFNSALVKRLTGLADKDLQNFMDSYRPGYSKVLTWNEYDAMSYISKSFKAFDAAVRPATSALPPRERLDR